MKAFIFASIFLLLCGTGLAQIRRDRDVAVRHITSAGVQFGPTLLQRKDVQGELALTDDQIATINALIAADPTGNNDPLRDRLAGPKMSEEQALRGILLPRQYLRYQEISLQAEGPIALGDKDFADIVGLTRKEYFPIEQLADAQKNAERRARDRRDKAEMKEIEEHRMETNRSIFEILTPSEKARWNAFLGERFRFTD
jgi:hypothetical protein